MGEDCAGSLDVGGDDERLEREGALESLIDVGEMGEEEGASSFLVFFVADFKSSS